MKVITILTKFIKFYPFTCKIIILYIFIVFKVGSKFISEQFKKYMRKFNSIFSENLNLVHLESRSNIFQVNHN